MRYQHRIKSIELASQARLRAKELLFTIYQDRITRINQRATDLQSAFGSFLGMYKAIEDESERRQLNEGMLEVFKQVYEFRREYFDELKEERRKVGLENTNPVQMSAIEDSLKLDVSSIQSQTEALQMVVGASGDSNAEYLSDGITESIINTLSLLPGLQVKACSTVFRYKGKEVDPQEAGRELGVSAVLVGRLLPLSQRMIIRKEVDIHVQSDGR